MALGPLFRAAGALGTDTPAGSACSITYTRKLLYWLWKDATAAAFEEESPQVSPQHCHGLQHQLLLRRPRAMFPWKACTGPHTCTTSMSLCT